jgi:hypothetical protein
LQCEHGSQVSREDRFTRKSQRLMKEVKAESSGLPCVLRVKFAEVGAWALRRRSV